MDITRRAVLAAGGGIATSAMLGRVGVARAAGFASKRPPVAERRFVNQAVEREIARVSG